MGRHFTLLFQFCRAGQPLVLEQFQLDAEMPGHGHGMNYHTSIKLLAPGRYEAGGLLFHMPGDWQLVLDVEYDRSARQFRLDYPI